jgi:hypothetical protein
MGERMTNEGMEKGLLGLVKPVADAKDAIEKFGKEAFETTVRLLEAQRALVSAPNSAGLAQMAKDRTDAQGGQPVSPNVDEAKKKTANDAKAAAGAAKEQVSSLQKAWDKAWENADQAAHKAFNSMFEKGKTTFKGVGDALKTGVLDVLYEATAKQWIVSIGGFLGLGGTSGSAQAAGAGGGAAAPGGGMTGLVESASKLYKSVTNGFGELSDTVSGTVQDVMNQFGFYPHALDGLATSSGQSLTSLASGAGWAASAASSFMAGSALNTTLSGKYQTGSGVETAEQIATAVAAAINPVAGVVVGAVSGLINHAFGMGDKEVTATGIRGTVGASGVDATNYQTWHQDGGWFRGDKDGTDVTPLNAATMKKFNDGFAAIKSATVGFAQELGLSANAIASYSKSFDIKLGKDAAANDKLITGLFTSIGNEMAQRLVPNLSKFTKSGETASAALERLAGDFQATNQAAQLIGKTAQEAFGAVGIASAAARERLIGLTGGTDALGQQTSFYAQNFMTEAQRLEPVQEALTAAMGDLGLSSVQTRSQFKAVIDSLDLTTAAGATQFAAMMKLAEAFAQIHPATESATDSIASARAALTTAYQTESDAIKATTDRMSNFAASLRKLHDGALLGNLSTLTPQQKYLEAKAQYEKTLSGARAGDADAQGQYQDAYNAFLSASQAVNASGAQYQRDFAYAQAATEDAIKWAEQQVDVGKASLDALNRQVAGLVDVKKEVTSVGQAIRDLASVMGPAGTGTVAASQDSAITALYQSMLHRAPDAAGLKFWEQAMAAGSSIADIAQAIGRSVEYQDASAGHGTMSGNRADVQVRDTAAYLAPAAPLDYGALGTSNMNALVGEIKALRTDNQSLRDEVRGLRGDAERQTGDLMAANAAVSDNSAGKIVEATARAALVAAQTRETRVMPT